MPTYTYRCDRCGEFDRIVPISVRDETGPCSNCGGAPARILTAVGLHSLTRGLDRAVEMAGRSAEAPATVTTVPPAAGGRPPPPRRGFPPLPRP